MHRSVASAQCCLIKHKRRPSYIIWCIYHFLFSSLHKLSWFLRANCQSKSFTESNAQTLRPRRPVFRWVGRVVKNQPASVSAGFEI